MQSPHGSVSDHIGSCRGGNGLEHPFDLSRSPNPHLGFGGGGPHFCLGNQLTKSELRNLFRELLTRLKRIEFGEVLSDLLPFYRQRYVVKPGVIGWSQLQCDPMPHEDTVARIEFDLYYIKHVSIVLDMYIILQGLRTMLASKEA